MDSSSRRDLRGLLGKKLAQASRKHLRLELIHLPYSVTAGDEFQTVSRSLRAIPQVILDLRAALQPMSLRIGIGFGRVPERIQAPVNRLGGEAFQFARKAIDAIKAKTLFKFEVLTAFQTQDEAFDRTINLIYGLHDTLALKISAKQWAAMQAFLDRPSVEGTARRLKVDKSTISRSLKRGYYWQLSETVEIAASLIERSFR
jgi:DNA-binding MarR family transcriptional regulator